MVQVRNMGAIFGSKEFYTGGLKIVEKGRKVYDVTEVTVRKRIPFFLAIVVIVIMHTVTCKKEKRATPESATKTYVPVTAPGTSLEEVPGLQPRIYIHPNGKIGYVLPEAMTIVIRNPEFQGDPDVIIHENTVKKCLSFNPKIQGDMVWNKEKNLELPFHVRLKPDTTYHGILKCLPLDDTHTIPIPPIEFQFQTPPFKFLGALTTKEYEPLQGIQLRFNYPVSPYTILQYIDLTDKEGNEIPVRDVKSGGSGILNLILDTKEKKEIQIRIKHGLPTMDESSTLSQDFHTTVYSESLGLTFSPPAIQQSKGTYRVMIHCYIPNIKSCQLSPDEIRRHLAIAPAVETKVVSTKTGFFLQGDFTPGVKYTFTLTAGLKSPNGGVLTKDETHSLLIPVPEPAVQFTTRGSLVGREGGVRLPFRIIGVHKLHLEVRRMPQSNIVPWYTTGWGGDWAFTNLSEPVVTKDLEYEPRPSPSLEWLDLNEVIGPLEGGIYRISLRVLDESGKERYGERFSDSMKVQVSDLALIAKREQNSVFSWALDAVSLKPVENVEIKLLSQKNVEMGRCRTNRQGTCRIEYAAIREREPYLLIAQNKNNMTVILFQESEIDLEPFSVGGRPLEDTNLIGYIYTERDLYRPGETLHIAAIVRQRPEFLGVSVPMGFEVFDPRGKLVVSRRVATNEDGLATIAVPTRPDSPTGKYHVRLIVGELELDHHGVFVEAFVPERLAVAVNPIEPVTYFKPDIAVRIQANYLFGAPAAEHPAELQCLADLIQWKPESFSDYRFGVSTPDATNHWAGAVEKVELDKSGATEWTCTIPNARDFQQPVQTTIVARVTEAGSGRTTESRGTAVFHPYPYYIGWKTDTSRFEEGRPFTVSGVVLEPEGNIYTHPLSLKYQISEVRNEYIRQYDPTNNRFHWERSEYIASSSEPAQLSISKGRFHFTFTPDNYFSRYRVEIWNDKDGVKAAFDVYGWGWWEKESGTPSPELLPISLTPSPAEFGTQVTATVQLPFTGRILWTVERERVLESRWLDAKGDISRFTFRVPSGVEMLYISALLVRSDPKYTVRRAFGVKKLPLRPKQTKLDMQLDVPDKIRPGQNLSITARADEPFSATVAVVDEGILQITRFTDPDPYSGLFGDWALIIRTIETFGLLMKKTEKTGGGEGGPGITGQPTFTRIVSYWSGRVKSDDKGILHVEVPIPEFHGRVRVMVVGATSTRFGSASASTRITSAIVVQPSIPRFVHHGDRIVIPVTLLNMSERKIQYNWSFRTKGAKIINKPNSPIEIDASERITLLHELEITELTDFLKLQLQGHGNHEVYNESFTIPIHPDLPELSIVETVRLKPGNLDLADRFKDWLPVHLESSLDISGFPAQTRLHHLRWLLHYPYGCVEQTTSSLLPLVFLRPLIPLIQPDTQDDAIYQNMVNVGISRLLSMQNGNGGFGFWPDDETSDPWASIYATFALVQARDAGFNVPEVSLTNAYNYLTASHRNEPFALYVLARAEKLSSLDVEYLETLADRDPIDFEDALWIAGALAKAGHRRSANRLLSMMDIKKLPATRKYEEDYYSPLRGLGLWLFILEEVSPGHPQAPSLVQEIVQYLNEPSHYYSTQELSWTMLALGKFMQGTAIPKSEYFQVTWNGSKVPCTTVGKTIHCPLPSSKIPEKLIVSNAGNENVFVTLSFHGFKKKMTYEPVEQGFDVVREYLKADGSPVDDIQVGDLLKVRLRIRSTKLPKISNVALEDRIPAGFEIENPRLRPTTQTPSSQKTGRNKEIDPDYLDIRDDRLVIFTPVTNQWQTYTYGIRAVTRGRFYHPPVYATAMYEPTLIYRSAPGSIVISDRK